RFEVDLRALGLHVHPAALAAQVAGIQDREIQERRKIFTALDAALELLDGQQPLHTEIPHEFPEQPRVGRAEDAERELRKHGLRTLARAWETASVSHCDLPKIAKDG